MSLRVTIVSLTNSEQNVFSEEKTVTIQNLLATVCALFNTEPSKTQLLYLDDEQDIIRVTTDQDLRMVMEETPESHGVTFFLTTTPPSLREYQIYKSFILRYFSHSPNMYPVPNATSEPALQPVEQAEISTPAAKEQSTESSSSSSESESTSESESESTSESTSESNSGHSPAAYYQDYSYPAYYYYGMQSPDSGSSEDSPAGYYDYYA